MNNWRHYEEIEEEFNEVDHKPFIIKKKKFVQCPTLI